MEPARDDNYPIEDQENIPSDSDADDVEELDGPSMNDVNQSSKCVETGENSSIADNKAENRMAVSVVHNGSSGQPPQCFTKESIQTPHSTGQPTEDTSSSVLPQRSPIDVQPVSSTSSIPCINTGDEGSDFHAPLTSTNRLQNLTPAESPSASGVNQLDASGNGCSTSRKGTKRNLGGGQGDDSTGEAESLPKITKLRRILPSSQKDDGSGASVRNGPICDTSTSRKIRNFGRPPISSPGSSPSSSGLTMSSNKLIYGPEDQEAGNSANEAGTNPGSSLIRPSPSCSYGGSSTSDILLFPDDKHAEAGPQKKGLKRKLPKEELLAQSASGKTSHLNITEEIGEEQSQKQSAFPFISTQSSNTSAAREIMPQREQERIINAMQSTDANSDLRVETTRYPRQRNVQNLPVFSSRLFQQVIIDSPEQRNPLERRETPSTYIYHPQCLANTTSGIFITLTTNHGDAIQDVRINFISYETLPISEVVLIDNITEDA